MKKFLLLALAAGLMFGACKKDKIVDKMTDDTFYVFSCLNKKWGISIPADNHGRPDYTEANKYKTASIKIYSLNGFDYNTDDYNRGQDVLVRIDKNKAFTTRISVSGDDPKTASLYGLSPDQLQQLKKGVKLLVEYDKLMGGSEIMEIDISGLKKFQ